MEVIREEKNKLLKDNLEHIRTIRNLNDSLDLLKKTVVDQEVNRANGTKTNKNKDEREKRERELLRQIKGNRDECLLHGEYFDESGDEYYHESEDDEFMEENSVVSNLSQVIEEKQSSKHEGCIIYAYGLKVMTKWP